MKPAAAESHNTERHNPYPAARRQGTPTTGDQKDREMGTKANPTGLDEINAPAVSRPAVVRPGAPASVARYRKLLQRAGALCFELAPDGTAVFVSDAAETLTGYRPDELLGRDFFAVLFPGPPA